MKLADNKDNSIVDDSLEKKDISVNEKSMKKIVSIISQYMYTDSSSAFREYWLNARESVDYYTKSIGKNGVDQGQSYCQPTEIQLPFLKDEYINVSYKDRGYDKLGYDIIVNPNQEERRFYIRDYGTGLTEKELETVVASAGETTKNDSNEYGGGLGIGTLSGFKVSDTIIFTAYKDGKQSQLLLSSHDNKLVKLPTIDTKEPNGVRVEFDILDDNKLKEFSDGALEFLNKAPKDERALIIYKNDSCLNDHINEATERYGNTISRITREEGEYIDLSINGCYYKGIYNNDLLNKVFKKIFSTYIEKVPENSKNYIYNKLLVKDFSTFLMKSFSWNVPVGHLQGISPTRESFTLNEKELTEYFSKILEENKKELEIVKDYCDSVYDYYGKNQEKELERKFYFGDYNYSSKPKVEKFSDIFELWLKKNNIDKIIDDTSSDNLILRYFYYKFPDVKGSDYSIVDDSIKINVSLNYSDIFIKNQSSYISITHNGKKYDACIYTNNGDNKYNDQKASLVKVDTNNRKHLISSNRNSKKYDWIRMLEDINNEDYHNVLNKKYCEEIDKIDPNDNFLFSNSSIYNTIKILHNMGINVSVYDDENAIDGSTIRKSYTQLFKNNKEKSSSVKYNVLINKDNKFFSRDISIEEISDDLKDCKQVIVYDVENDSSSPDDLYKKYNFSDVFNIVRNVLYKGEDIAFVRTNKTTQKFSKLYKRLEDNGVSFIRIKDLPNKDEIFKKCIDVYPIAKNKIKFMVVTNCLVEKGYLGSYLLNEIDSLGSVVEFYNSINKMGLYSDDTFVELEKEVRNYGEKEKDIPYSINNFIKEMCRKPHIKNYVFEKYDAEKLMQDIIFLEKIKDSYYFSFVDKLELSLEDKKKVFDIMVEKLKK